MKITDLKPNQAIEISNSKEARKFRNITKMYVNIGDMLSFSHDCWFFSPKAPVILPASKFLKPSLNKRVKALERKIKVLEKGSDFMQEINNIEVNSDVVANCNDVPVKEELTELPEKWCVLRNNDNKILVGSWFNKNRQNNSTFDFVNSQNGDNYFHYPCDSSRNHTQKSVLKGYTEISTEDFKLLVLKENEPAKEPESIDWSKPGQLVINENGAIRMTTGEDFDEYFKGILIVSKTGKDLGTCLNSYHKSEWELYKGEPITLKND